VVTFVLVSLWLGLRLGLVLDNGFDNGLSTRDVFKRTMRISTSSQRSRELKHLFCVVSANFSFVPAQH